MVRFKDVTKVVLVLALCFTFAGVGNATTHEANKRDFAAQRTRVIEYKKVLEKLYMEYMSKKADLKFYCELPAVEL